MPSRCKLLLCISISIALLYIGISTTMLPVFSQTASSNLVTSAGILDTAQSYITTPPKAHLKHHRATSVIPRRATSTAPIYVITTAAPHRTVIAEASHHAIAIEVPDNSTATATRHSTIATAHNTNGGSSQKRLTPAGSSLLGVSLNLAELGLSEDQKRIIQDSRKFARLKLHELREARKVKVMQLRDMLFNPSSTTAQIKECDAEILHLQDSMDNVNLESLIQLRSILTPEQRAKLASLICDKATSEPVDGRTH